MAGRESHFYAGHETGCIQASISSKPGGSRPVDLRQ
jgi:hypothetical protein